MYFQLSSAIKRRMIKELRNFWQYAPAYKDLVENIQGKYSFKERPQHCIIVKVSGGGNRNDFAADNFKGVVPSYVYLTKYQNYPGVAIEWIREDSVAMQNNHARFPSPPGVYFIELTEDTEFCVDALLDVTRELVTMSDPSTGQLRKAPLDGTIRLYEQPSGFMLGEGTNYTLTKDSLGKPTGGFTLGAPLTGGRFLTADYRYPGESRGPFHFNPMHSNNQAIPGVVLAFGNRNAKGDRMAVVVQDIRRPAYLVYGGQWDLSMELEVGSRDLEAQMEIADSTAIYIWAILRSYLSTEGIEITECSLGGESEEAYDENGDDYFYNATLNVTVRTDWEVHVPLSVFIRQVTPLTKPQMQRLINLPDDEIDQIQSNIRMVESLGLEHVRDPFFTNRGHTFEMID